MRKILDIPEKCTGCSACVAVCPVHCIQLIENEEGFLYPQVDEAKCINCGKCDHTCPQLRTMPGKLPWKAYYGYHKDEDIRYTSSSGGAFAALAQKVLDEGGVVFGAVFDAHKKAVVHCSTDEASLIAIQKSKYVQSDPLNTFLHVNTHLKNGRRVLYCGTACQIHGLLSCLGGAHPLLITCDFICHGVPSSGLFREHLLYLESKKRKKVSAVDFRSKEMGWTGANIHLSLCMDGRNVKIPHAYDTFYKGFITENVVLRKCCYDCRYTDRHYADITLADFWGYRKLDPALNDEKGLSLLFANTEQGEKMLASIQHSFYLNPLEDKYAEYAFHRKDYSEFRKKRDAFFDLVKKIGFEKAARQTYCQHNMYHYGVYKIKRWIKSCMGR